MITANTPSKAQSDPPWSTGTRRFDSGHLHRETHTTNPGDLRPLAAHSSTMVCLRVSCSM